MHIFLIFPNFFDRGSEQRPTSWRQCLKFQKQFCPFVEIVNAGVGYFCFVFFSYLVDKGNLVMYNNTALI